MAPVVIASMMQGGSEDIDPHKLHPFFTKGPIDAISDSATSRSAYSSDVPDEFVDPSLRSIPANGRKKRRTGDPSSSENLPAVKKSRRKTTSTNQCISNYVTTTSDGISNIGPLQQVFDTPMLQLPCDNLGNLNSQASCAVQPSNPPNVPLLPNSTAVPDTGSKATPKTKMLKFNLKTGTLGSPPKPSQPPKPSLVVVIKYGNDAQHKKDLGDKITQILGGQLKIPLTPPKRRIQRKMKRPDYKEKLQTLEERPKSAHPFFASKPKPTSKTPTPIPEAKNSPPRKRNVISMSTPISPRKSRPSFLESKKSSWGGMKPIATKVPGALHPMWPCQDMVHVRGGCDDETGFGVPSNPSSAELSSRKHKGQLVRIPARESVLSKVKDRLHLNNVRANVPADDDFESAPKELRLPARLFESGRKLRSRITRQLRSRPDVAIFQATANFDELSEPPPVQVHPIIMQLYTDLETRLSAYDRSDCESLAWTQKYSPNTACQVLQAGKEAFMLKEWLEALKVQSVDTGIKETVKTRDKSTKKRKKYKLDGFIVGSDDEEEMEEVSEDETNWLPSTEAISRKTVVRPVKDTARLVNAVLISGPPGSGKTAAVYAVAKELGFEIFEINAASRRSGKDILERVGDMTRNHLVHQNKSGPTGENKGVNEDEVDREVKSGKQGMMTAFFKLKVAPPVPPAQPKTVMQDAKTKDDAKPSHKSQKQSLILIEEADILYEEDKQIWPTVMTLMSQSKRPFIITCNDETQVPIHSLNLHGIFRFSPPPTDLAVDTCLLIAASEGHALQRPAVHALYESRGHDLRATITELNYWCQLGVGDRRGGFDWFYLRWPKGSDLDDRGHVVRVVSENTYMNGMGWLARDPVVTPKPCQVEEDEIVNQCWDSWGLSASDWCSPTELASYADSVSNLQPRMGRVAGLDAYQELCESISMADVCSNGVFGTGLQAHLDPSLPEITPKAKEDFVLGRQFLQADPLTHYTNPSRDISNAITSLARRLLFHSMPNTSESSGPKTIDEKKAISTIFNSFKPSPPNLTRFDIALAFDPIAISDNATPQFHLDPSVFDRTLNLIVLDVAPWIRGIVSFDQYLMQERKKLSSLLSEGGNGRKRMRNTRAAYSALEGGERGRTRRERYFRGNVNPIFVMRTGMDGWRDAMVKEAVTETADVRI